MHHPHRSCDIGMPNETTFEPTAVWFEQLSSVREYYDQRARDTSVAACSDVAARLQLALPVVWMETDVSISEKVLE